MHIPRIEPRTVATLALALCGAALVLVQTRFGPGTSGDSTSYLMGAETLLKGEGFSRYSGGYELRPITGFPPFYSLTLAALGQIGLDLLTAARMLDALLFTGNILLAAALVWAFTASFWASFAAGALLLAQETQFLLHTWVMSEPLYIFLTLVAVYALARGIRSGVSWPWILTAAVLTGLSSLTRLVGPSLSAAGALCILAFGRRGRRPAFAQGLAYAALSLLPLFVWMRWNAGRAGTAINRELGYHPIEPDLLRLFLAEASSWFVPHDVPLPTAVRAGLAVVLAAGLIGGFLLFAARRWVDVGSFPFQLRGPGEAEFRILPWLLGGYALANAAVIFVNSTFLDASTTSTAPPRYLSPIFVALLILGACAASQWRRMGRYAVPLKWTAAGYALVLWVLFAAKTAQVLRDPLPHLGYTGRRLTWTRVVGALDAIPANQPIVSNNPEIVYVLAGRPAYVRPIRYDNYQEELREDYEQQFVFLQTALKDGGYFVVFDDLEADDQAFIDRFDVQPLEDFPNYGVRIYRVNPAPSAGTEGALVGLFTLGQAVGS